MTQKKVLGLAVRIVVTALVLAFLGWKLRDELGEFARTVAQANYVWLGMAYAGYLMVLICAVFRWQLLLRAQQLLLRPWPLFKYFMIGLFFNNFMLGTTGGDIVKCYYVSRETHQKKTEAMTTVFIDRIVGMFALVGLALVALLFNMGNPEMKMLAVSVFSFFALIAVSFAIFLNKRLLKMIPFGQWIMDRLPFRAAILRIYEAFHVYHGHKGAVAGALSYSVFLQVMMVIIVWGMGKALGIEGVGFLHYLLLVPVVSAVSALPISFGGLGLAEGAFVYFFNLIQEQSAQYLALGLTLRFLLIFWGVAGGLFLLLPKTGIPAGELEKGLDREGQGA